MDASRMANDLQELQRIFPGADSALLKDFYEQSAYRLDLTIDFLMADPSVAEKPVERPIHNEARGFLTQSQQASSSGGPREIQRYARQVASVPYVVHHTQDIKCLGCETLAMRGGLFCSPDCISRYLQRSPLAPLPLNHPVRGDIESQFTAEWRHDTPCPKVQFVYAIISAPATAERYAAYRDLVESKRRCQEFNLKPGNEQLRWHGTRRRCKVGEKSTKLCDDELCALCQIIKTSFDVAKFGKRWGRFGTGIYTSATSSKSHDYIRNRSRNLWKLRTASPFQAILLNQVVVGTSKHLQVNADYLKRPPEGYDSVSGEAGRDLNYDETVVYSNEAILPAFLIL